MDDLIINLDELTFTVVEADGRFIIVTEKSNKELYTQVPQLKMILDPDITKEKAWELTYYLGECLKTVSVSHPAFGNLIIDE